MQNRTNLSRTSTLLHCKTLFSDRMEVKFQYYLTRGPIQNVSSSKFHVFFVEDHIWKGAIKDQRGYVNEEGFFCLSGPSWTRTKSPKSTLHTAAAHANVAASQAVGPAASLEGADFLDISSVEASLELKSVREVCCVLLRRRLKQAARLAELNSLGAPRQTDWCKRAKHRRGDKVTGNPTG